MGPALVPQGRSDRLPAGPDGLRGDQQSPALDEFQERLRAEGLETTWQPTYNAGANPVPVRLRQADLSKPVVQELLRATFEILDTGGPPLVRKAWPVSCQRRSPNGS